jgi:hypothetical protein
MIVQMRKEKSRAMRAGWSMILLFSALSSSQESEAPVCQSHSPYFLVIRARTDSVGSDVLVKYGPDRHPCAYKAEGTDFELKDVNTNRFVKFADPYLFLGGSTGPDGGDFLVFDLKARVKVYQHIFMGKDIRISGNTVFYTQRLGTATPGQCKTYDAIVKQGFSAVIVADVSFPVEDLAHPDRLKSLAPSNPRCTAQQ